MTTTQRGITPAWAGVALGAAALLLQACASLDPDYEEPTVTISTFRPLPAEGIVPTFEIGLRILNPNASDLRLDGIVYTVSLQGRKLVKGVGRDFPVIEGYSEETVTLTAVPNVIAGIQLFTDLAASPEQALFFELEARLDLAGPFRTIRVREGGELKALRADAD